MKRSKTQDEERGWWFFKTLFKEWESCVLNNIVILSHSSGKSVHNINIIYFTYLVFEYGKKKILSTHSVGT